MDKGDAKKGKTKFRSHGWFNNENVDLAALYTERYANYGLTKDELQGGRPIIGIAQTGSDLSPCNRHHSTILLSRMRDGVIAAGGIPMEFPAFPIQETGARPTAALHRNLAALSLTETLRCYPIDAVILTTGCDKTTPACLMAAASVNIPSIVLSGGPMLNGHLNGGKDLAGSGTIIWQCRHDYAKGAIGREEFMDRTLSSAPSPGHCNTMGTALSMNSLAEALGMSLPGCAAIPAVLADRTRMAYDTGKRIVEMAYEDLKPSDILTREAFENTIVVASAIGGSSNCPPHILAIAKHMGVELNIDDWQTYGHDVPLLVNCMPAGEYLGEQFYYAGGIPSVIHELMKRGLIKENALTVNNKTIGENCRDAKSKNEKVIFPVEKPMMEKAGFAVLSGNLFDNAIMKISVISDTFKKKYIKDGILEGDAIVFDGPEEYHSTIDNPELGVTENSILVIRGCGSVGYPGSAEVVNMIPPDHLIKQGVSELPCIGDGRQSGTSASPSILNASPEAAVGGGLAYLKNGDRIRIDLNSRSVNALVPADEWASRKANTPLPQLKHNSMYVEMFRNRVTQLGEGGYFKGIEDYKNLREDELRHSH
ncbi:UNVERIFIED_CONTAM: hypothetical protein GTU68_039332 [Idotea baltica]|nr:hypothetical protein [Idotea baltica]